MKKSSMQIQSILYDNKKEFIFRSLDSLERAIEISKNENGNINLVDIYYGDASDTPVFTQEEIEDLQKKYAPAFSFNIKFFGFNSGTSKGHNILAQDCKTDYMMIMNPDIIVTPRFFLEIMKPFSEEPDNTVGMVEARQTPIEHPKCYDLFTKETSWASNACAVLTTETFHLVDGYDENSFFMYCDDVDLSWRIRLKGKKIFYQPTAVVFHAKRLSKKAAWKPTYAERYFSAQAALFMSYKWSGHTRLRELLMRFLNSNDEVLISVAVDFEKLKNDKRLSSPMKNRHEVAIFYGDNYAEHRFFL